MIKIQSRQEAKKRPETMGMVPHPSVVPKAQEILKIELPPVRPITVISSNSFDRSAGPPGDAPLSDPGSPGQLGCDHRCPLGSTVSLHTLAGRRRTLSHSRISLRSETTGSSSCGGVGVASDGGHHQHHHHHHHHHAHHAHRGHAHRRHSASQSPRQCTHHRRHQAIEHHQQQEVTGGEQENTLRRRREREEEEEEEEEMAGTTATICTEDERHAGDSASTMYAENCHCSRGNLTTTDDDDEIQQYFVVDQPQPQSQPHQQHQPYTAQQASSLQCNLSRRPSVSSSHRSARSTPRSRRVTTPLSGGSCCSHHSHHSQPAGPVGGTSGVGYSAGQHGPQSPTALSRRTLPDSGGSNATISNFNINPARFQCSYYTADESENSYCSISGENIRQIQAQTAIQHQLDREEQRQRLQPLPLSGPPEGALINDNDSQQDIASLNESLLSTVGSTSSDQPGGSTTTTTSTTTSTTQRQLQQVQGTPKSAGSQLVLTPSKITIENIGQLSEIGTANYEFDDLDINIPEIFQSPSKIKWSFLANLDESKSNKSRISSVSSLVDVASSGRGRSGTESGGADVSETASDNEYSPNRIRRRRPEPLPVGEPSQPTAGQGIQTSSSSCKIEELLKKSSPSASASDFKTVSIWRAENGDEGNAIIFHHESEIVENCCTNHFLDHSSYDVCRVDNCDYLIKSSDTDGTKRTSSCGSLCKNEERLNNTLPVASTTFAGLGTKQLELKQRNIFTSTLAGTTTTSASMTSACGASIPTSATTATVYSIISPDLKRFEKQTNLNRNSVNLSQNLPPSSPSSSSTSSIFAGNYGSAVYRNINQSQSQQQQQQHHHSQTSEHDKLLNTSMMSRGSSQRSRLHTAPASTISRSATSSMLRSGRQPSGSGVVGFNNQSNNYPSSTLDRSTLGARTLSTASLGFSDTRREVQTPTQPGDPAAPPFSITGVGETAASAAAAAAATQFYNKSYHYNLTAQNQLYFQAFSNLVREQEQQQQQQNCEFHQAQPQTPSPQPQPSCPQCYEYYDCQAQYYANATNEADNEFAECNAGGGSGSVVLRRGGWRRNVGTTLRINGLVRVVRTRARKCADYIRQKEHQSNNRFRRRK
uniref:Uncharacterized protein n=1 Tax=Anopheles epiroticus TaxID=199890 RepID=A0A182PRC5_9DIPT